MPALIYRWLIGFGLLLATMATCYIKGRHDEQDKQQVELITQVVRMQAAAKDYEQDKQQTEVVYRTITKQVVKYVEAPHNSCTVDAEWVRLYNDAVLARGAGVDADRHEADAAARGSGDD